MRSCIVLFVGEILEAISMFCYSIYWMSLAKDNESIKWMIFAFLIFIAGRFLNEMARQKKMVELKETTLEEGKDVMANIIRTYNKIYLWVTAVIVVLIICIFEFVLGTYNIYSIVGIIIRSIGIIEIIYAIIKLYKSI